VVKRLNDALKLALADENTRNRLLNLGAVLPAPAEQTPAHLGNFVKQEIARWTPVLQGQKK
jgi:tripartite-type tricarboxylate transporter receptor subunit TctC